MKPNRTAVTKRTMATAATVVVARKPLKVPSRTRSFLPLLDRVNVVKQVQLGFPVAAIETLSEALHLTQQSLLRIAHIAPATLARRRTHPDERLSPAESDRIYRIAATCDLALRLFEGDATAARRWLNEPAKALGGLLPLEHLATEAGAAQVRDLIGRLESSVYA